MIMKYADNIDMFGLLHVKYEMGIPLQRPAFQTGPVELMGIKC